MMAASVTAIMEEQLVVHHVKKITENIFVRIANR